MASSLPLLCEQVLSLAGASRLFPTSAPDFDRPHRRLYPGTGGMKATLTRTSAKILERGHLG
jgi:hypothetical protein